MSNKYLLPKFAQLRRREASIHMQPRPACQEPNCNCIPRGAEATMITPLLTAERQTPPPITSTPAAVTYAAEQGSQATTTVRKRSRSNSSPASNTVVGPSASLTSPAVHDSNVSQLRRWSCPANPHVHFSEFVSMSYKRNLALDVQAEDGAVPLHRSLLQKQLWTRLQHVYLATPEEEYDQLARRWLLSDGMWDQPDQAMA